MTRRPDTVELLRRRVASPVRGRRSAAGPDPAAVESALEGVVDPCSLAQGTPLSLPAMGLVRGWECSAGVLRVVIAVTGPGCTLVGNLARGVVDACAHLDGVEEIVVDLRPGVVWTEAELRDDARRTLQRHRPRRPTPGDRSR
jgi:metal-sulfur cluster biosynthetic enzyme